MSEGWGCPSGIMTKVLDFSLEVSKSKLHLCYYIHFQTNILWEKYELLFPPSLPPSYAFNSITARIALALNNLYGLICY